MRAVFSAGTGIPGVVERSLICSRCPPVSRRRWKRARGSACSGWSWERFEHARAAGLSGAEGPDRRRSCLSRRSPATAPHRKIPPTCAGRPGSSAGPRPGLLDYLLGHVGVVDHLDQAERLWRRNRVIATYVTPSGGPLPERPAHRRAARRRPRRRITRSSAASAPSASLRDEVAATASEVEARSGGTGGAGIPARCPARSGDRSHYPRCRARKRAPHR